MNKPEWMRDFGKLLIIKLSMNFNLIILTWGKEYEKILFQKTVTFIFVNGYYCDLLYQTVSFKSNRICESIFTGYPQVRSNPPLQ